MKRVYLRAKRPVTEVDRAAVGLYNTGAHIGFLHRDDSSNSTPSFLHLCDHRFLANGPVPSGVKVWIAPDIHPLLLPHLAGWCRRVIDLHLKPDLPDDKKMPYGLSFWEDFFDDEGRIRPGAVGLTCSTFVLAIFHQVGVKLVDHRDWPKVDAGDKAERNRMTDLIRRKDPAQADKLPSDATPFRVTPLQVAAAASEDADRLPLNHKSATYLGGKIQKMLR